MLFPRHGLKEESVIPIKTSVEDIQKVLGYLARQVGWVETAKAEKALGALDDRKVSAMVEFGLILRDGGNLKATPRGQLFSSGKQAEALREVLNDVDLYRATLEWAHYGGKSEVTATEVGQYWESARRHSRESPRDDAQGRCRLLRARRCWRWARCFHPGQGRQGNENHSSYQRDWRSCQRCFRRRIRLSKSVRTERYWRCGANNGGSRDLHPCGQSYASGTHVSCVGDNESERACERRDPYCGRCHGGHRSGNLQEHGPVCP